MSVSRPQPFSFPAFVAVPAARAYRIINVRVPVDLAPILANQADDDRLVACEIVVEAAGGVEMSFAAAGLIGIAVALLVLTPI
jgi:hypothetical protein